MFENSHVILSLIVLSTCRFLKVLKMRDPQSEWIIMDKLIKMDANWGVQSVFSIIFIHDSLKPTILTPNKNTKNNHHRCRFSGASNRLWLISYRMTAVSAAGMGVLISVVVPEHSATLATSVSVIVAGPRPWHISDFNGEIWGKSGQNHGTKDMIFVCFGIVGWVSR